MNQVQKIKIRMNRKALKIKRKENITRHWEIKGRRIKIIQVRFYLQVF